MTKLNTLAPGYRLNISFGGLGGKGSSLCQPHIRKWHKRKALRKENIWGGTVTLATSLLMECQWEQMVAVARFSPHHLHTDRGNQQFSMHNTSVQDIPIQCLANATENLFLASQVQPLFWVVSVFKFSAMGGFVASRKMCVLRGNRLVEGKP